MFAVSATLAPTYSDGSAWDAPGEPFGGALPDPFADFEMPVDNSLGYTDVLTDTLTPAWNQPVIPATSAVRASDLLPGGQAWDLWVGDEDANHYADVMCELDGPLTLADLQAGGFTRTNVDSCLSVTVRLTCAM